MERGGNVKLPIPAVCATVRNVIASTNTASVQFVVFAHVVFSFGFAQQLTFTKPNIQSYSQRNDTQRGRTIPGVKSDFFDFGFSEKSRPVTTSI